MHILIVEDDEVARDYLAKALREAGHTVDVAGNGLEGLHMASSVAVDLAIVDRMLPKLDGLALVQSLRGGDLKTRAYRQMQVEAAIRFCDVLFGHDYASLMSRAAEIALTGERRPSQAG